MLAVTKKWLRSLPKIANIGGCPARVVDVAVNGAPRAGGCPPAREAAINDICNPYARLHAAGSGVRERGSPQNANQDGVGQCRTDLRVGVSGYLSAQADGSRGAATHDAFLVRATL
eukprot:scaffold98438_cov69-Phaeocystis_antarctica.AAC.3